MSYALILPFFPYSHPSFLPSFPISLREQKRRRKKEKKRRRKKKRGKDNALEEFKTKILTRREDPRGKKPSHKKAKDKEN